MTTKMVRKQFYIRKDQDELLKRLAQERGLSESEIIRQAIDREAAEEPDQPVHSGLSAIGEFACLVLSNRSPGTKAESYRWNRADIYAERESRWLRDRNDE